jgi:hypothetical protein
VLIDAQSLKFKPSILVAAVFSASLEITMNLNKGEVEKASPLLCQIELCNKAWDKILSSIFGDIM